MSVLKCVKCGIERSYADSIIADVHKTCNSDVKPELAEDGYRLTYGGNEHNWGEI